jgi:hypothetical protein
MESDDCKSFVAERLKYPSVIHLWKAEGSRMLRRIDVQEHNSDTWVIQILMSIDLIIDICY